MDTQETVLAAAQAGDESALTRMLEVASRYQEFPNAAERERFYHNVRVQLAFAKGPGAR